MKLGTVSKNAPVEKGGNEMTMTIDEFMKAHDISTVMEHLNADKRRILQSFAMGYEFGIATAKNDSNAPKPTGEKTA
jgi:hypothetical protein